MNLIFQLHTHIFLSAEPQLQQLVSWDIVCFPVPRSAPIRTRQNEYGNSESQSSKLQVTLLPKAEHTCDCWKLLQPIKSTISQENVDIETDQVNGYPNIMNTISRPKKKTDGEAKLFHALSTAMSQVSVSSQRTPY